MKKIDPAWKIEPARLVRTWEQKDFLHALAFVNAIGWLAEQVNHHPDVTIRGWNKVDVVLSTHDAGGLTERDYDLAARIDALLADR